MELGGEIYYCTGTGWKSKLISVLNEQVVSLFVCSRSDADISRLEWREREGQKVSPPHFPVSGPSQPLSDMFSNLC